MARILYVAKLAVDKNSGLPLPSLAGQTVTIVRRGTTTPVSITEDEAGTLVIPSSARTVSAQLFIPAFWVNESDMPVSALGGGIEVPLETAEGIAKRLNTLEPQVAAAVSSAAASALAAANAQAAAEAAAGGGSGGTSDHGSLSGLLDDDHTQYHNDSRGDARYYTKGQVDTLTNNAASANSAADRSRANHTGTQPISSVAGLQEILDSSGTASVNSVAGKIGNVTLVSSDISDTGAVGRTVMGATTDTAARSAIGAAPTSHQHPSTGISDSTGIGRGLMTATDAAAARSVIGAGTSSVVVGTTVGTAMDGGRIRLNPSSTAGLADGTFVART